MSQSTPEQREDRVVLFQHAGELSEFKGLFSELAVPIEERGGSLPRPADLEGARLVVVCGNRLLEKGAPNLGLWPRTIAVIDDASRTLVSQLSRVGAAMVIRRPIHPRALRLLLLHEIYRGPERRTRQRVLIGNPIRISSGLFRPHATLLDLSPTGARIELAHAPKVGTKIRILIGKDLTKAKPVKLQAKVVRLIKSAEDSVRGESEIGVAILDANRHSKTIKAILNRFSLGPASWNSKARASGTDPRTTASSTPTPTQAPASASASTNAPAGLIDKPVVDGLPPTQSRSALPPTRRASDTPTVALTSKHVEEPEFDDALATATAKGRESMPTTEGSASPEPANLRSTKPASQERGKTRETKDRRQETRIPYEQRIVALGEEAARVLVGRDLSRGGMRIAATPAISVGDVLRVALHSGMQTEPIVITARALRDDGEDGLVLAFDDLSPSQSDELEKIISSGLPVHASSEEFQDPDTTNPSIVVAEMIETLSSNESADPLPGEGLGVTLHASVESDAEIDAHLDSVFDTGESV